MLHWPRVGLIVFFMPAVWQVYTGKPTLFLDFLWDGCVFYQWQFAGTNIAGATNAAYTLTNAQANDDGVYTVTITNSSGQASRTASLELVQPPQIASIAPPT